MRQAREKWQRQGGIIISRGMEEACSKETIWRTIDEWSEAIGFAPQNVEWTLDHHPLADCRRGKRDGKTVREWTIQARKEGK